MITNDVKTRNTLATEILLALDELQAQVEAKGLEQFVVESRFSDTTRGYAICWQNGALHAVDAAPYEEFNAAEGIVIAGLDSRKHITLPDLYSHPHGDLATSWSACASSGGMSWPMRTLRQWRRL